MQNPDPPDTSSATVHIPVLADEVIQSLSPQPGQLIVDGTLGGGGHTRRIAERVQPTGSVLAIDRDPAAIHRAQNTLAGLPIRFLHSDFRELPRLLQTLGIERVDAILLDLGLSSDQLRDSQRGFSFGAEGVLDLRFDTNSGAPAWQLLQEATAEEIADILFLYGEERFSRRIARQVIAQRQHSPIRLAAEFAELVRRCVPRSKNHRIDPATRSFQALRIAVNDELGALKSALQHFPDLLQAGGRLAIISFHSLEDRLVKHAFRDDPRLLVLTKKPIRPNEAEVSQNPRSRSARLRVAQRR